MSLSRAAALALAAVLSLSGCERSAPDRGSASAPAIAVATINVEARRVPDYASVPATVVASRQARIASRLSGYIERVTVSAGDRVKAGELLIAIDPSDARGGLAQAEASLARAQAVFADAQANHQRFANLYRQEAATRQQFEGVEREFAAARSQVEAARAAVAVARAQLAYAEIRAPYAGVIVSREADPGDLATPGKTLLVLEDPAQLEVRAQVDDAAYAALAHARTIAVRIGERTVETTLLQRVPAADPQSHTHLVRLALPADAGVSSGSYVTVLVPLGEREALVVPPSAIAIRAGIAGVFVVGTDGTAQFRLVRAGAATPAGVEVQAGLTAGETIVAAPDERIANGTRIAQGKNGGA